LEGIAMLVDLRVKNFAIVEDGTLHFDKGMIAFTGETGAGKSLLFDAITLLLGAKAKSDLVRTGATNAEVEGVFDLSSAPEQLQRLEQLGFEVDPADGALLMVRREFSSSDISKNRIWIQGHSATRKQLQEVLGDLVEISGQHEFLKLGREEVLLSLVDQYGGLKSDVADFGELYAQYDSLRKELHSLEQNEGHKEARRDFLKFQIEELEKAGIRPGLAENEKEWSALRTRLGSVEKIRVALEKSLLALDGEEGGDSLSGALSALALLNRELRALEAFGDDLKTYSELAADLQSRAEDLSYHLRSCLERLDADPAALDEAETRLSHLQRLKRKYNVDTEGLIAMLDSLRLEFSRLDNSEENLERLRKNFKEIQKRMRARALDLHIRRVKAAEELQKLWQRDIRLLGMPQASLKLEVTELAEAHSRGLTKVQALFSANAGERLQPVAKVASGGELSRIMLALKNIVAGRSEVGVYLFDEVDAGIGGETAHRVAERLKAIAKNNQVLVVTHLASIAAAADAQFLIAKETVKGRTRTHIVPLSEKDRATEIARMLGESSSKAALQLAKEMLGKSKTSKASRNREMNFG
jgi:DNA repair protein RecN (Recombination protein N)